MKLKPCPFCGSEPRTSHPKPSEFIIQCDNPECPVRVCVVDNFDLPVESWNTRAHEKEISALESRLKHLLQSEAVRLYDEFDPTISGGYKRDISELDHLVFDSKREEKEDKTAHWDICCDGFYPFCSHCGEAAERMSPHCPNCGAKMVTRRHEP